MRTASFSFCFNRFGGPIKNGLSYDALGLLIQTDASHAQRNFDKYLHLLELTLERQGVMPRRNFDSSAEFEAFLREDKDIILDGSEQPTQRPSNDEAQKETYSGKKNAIHIKN